MKQKGMISRLLALILCVVLLLPVPVSATDIYFTSINDNLLPLTSETMPVWSGGLLYVPYTVFDSNYSGVSLGIYSNYSKNSNSVSVFNLRQMLVFDLNNNSTRNEMTGETYSVRAILRNGRPFLPLNLVCDFFGLSHSYTTTSQGYLVRIKNDAVVLSDAKFIDAAGDLINRRLKEYTQSLNPATPTAPTTPTTPSTPSTPDDDSTSADVRTYLAFRCQGEDGIADLLDTLDNSGAYALFLFSPQMLEEESDLVRRILGTGHSIGLLAEGDNLTQTQTLLAQGNRLLEQIAFTRTSVAIVPPDQRSALEKEGWVLWRETMSLSPSATVGPNTFAYNTVRQLEGRTRSTYLTLDGDANTARILPSLLRQLDSKHFVVSIPMETKL
ncbi:MAG: hypothetical protein VB071_07450 [Lawsonibacter sp.]|nr:hypothetical protein [Lawsonibacter sp.]